MADVPTGVTMGPLPVVVDPVVDSELIRTAEIHHSTVDPVMLHRSYDYNLTRPTEVVAGRIWVGPSPSVMVVLELQTQLTAARPSSEAESCLGVLNVAQECDASTYKHIPKRWGYTKLPLDDNPDQPIDPSSLSRSVQTQIDIYGAVYVHCLAGISRSCTAVLCWLCFERGMAFEEALVCLRLQRPCARPNPGFMRALKGISAEQRQMYRAVDAPVSSIK